MPNPHGDHVLRGQMVQVVDTFRRDPKSEDS
jgi:hypothetical protein